VPVDVKLDTNFQLHEYPLATRRKFGRCALCDRNTHLTFHHLIPKKLHRRKHFKKNYDKATLQSGIDICNRCHKGLHVLFDEMTLGRTLNTVALLKQNPTVAKHCEWVARQKQTN